MESTALTNREHPGREGDELYRRLPAVHEVMLMPTVQQLAVQHRRETVLGAVRKVLSSLREAISADQLTEEMLDQKLAQIANAISTNLQAGPEYSLRPVINATGVILHTNLGRAPLSEAAIAHIAEIAEDYCNLEFDLETGERSRRDVHVERLVLRVFGITGEDADRWGVVIVNNCAAATFLALNSLAEKREVVVSRGELVEIGGGFRIPEILEKSGAILKEVGTTNRTRIADYERAVNEQTALLLRVHQSNFSIEGFVERPTLEELISLARTIGVPVFEDQGTGLLADLARFGISGQPTLRESIAYGVDLVAASGDKLMGGPQCGLLIGRKDLIARIRKNPLLRAFRVDKLTYAALEATLFAYLEGTADALPSMRMIGASVGEIEERCQRLAESVQSKQLRVQAAPLESVVGGGTAPSAKIRSFGLLLWHEGLGADALVEKLRNASPPVIGRILDGAVVLDLRTVPPRFDVMLKTLLEQI